VIVVYRGKSNHDDRIVFDAKTKGEAQQKLRSIAVANHRRAADYELDPLYEGRPFS